MTGRVLTTERDELGALFDGIARELERRGCEVRRRFDCRAMDPSDPDLAWAEAVVTCTNSVQWTRPLLAAAGQNVRGIAYVAIGTNSIDPGVATENGIAIANAPVDDNVQSMAEAAIMLMLALSYRLDRSRAALHAAERPAHFAHMLKGRTIGLVGYGRIARAIVRRLAAWDVTLLGHTRSPPAEEGVAFVGLDELLARSDVVSVHVPLTPETCNLLDAGRLERMKPGAILVNLARGGIVDETALERLMRDGHIAGAALDVFATEPLPQDDPLNGLSNTILTPHIVGHTIESTQSLVDCTADNVARMLAGQPPRNLINPDVLQAWCDRWGSQV